ncbi:MAG: glycosyltransferase family 25 protein [Gammaproteobacteria bacterium]|nr:glycosyltransferase family 25 protein [Gammaproteobacteria bacterium]
MKIFVISLDDQHDRRAAIAQQLHGLGLEFEFFDAVRGSDNPLQHFPTVSNLQYQLNTRREPLPNEVGCYASHLSMWKRCAELGEPVVIMEDDFVAQSFFPEAIEAAGVLIDHFGFIRFEPFRRGARLTRSRRGARKIVEQGSFELYYLADPPLCMTAYAVNPESARALAAASAKLVGPVDKFIQRTWVHGVPLFALNPPSITVSAQADTSTIGSRRKKSKNPLLMLARLLYKSVGQFRRGRFNARQLKLLGAA